MYGVENCSFAKTARPTIIACETEEKFGCNRTIEDRGFHGGGGARMSAAEKHVVRNALQIHDHVKLVRGSYVK